MADKQVMEIQILPSGEVKITVKCVPGAACEAVSAALEQSLGSVKDKQRTSEYYEEVATESQTVGSR
jgi:hypothetical protein